MAQLVTRFLQEPKFDPKNSCLKNKVRKEQEYVRSSPSRVPRAPESSLS